MSIAKFRIKIIAGIALIALSLSSFTGVPNWQSSTNKQPAKAKSNAANQNYSGNKDVNNNGNDINNAGSPAEVRHERTGSLNPYSYGSIKSHEENKGAKGPTGKH